MKTLKQKIILPHFFIIIAMPIVIFLVFVITLLLYASNVTKHELVAFADNVDTAFKPRIHIDAPTIDATDLLDSNIRDDYDILRASLQISKYYEFTDFFLLNGDEFTLLPETQNETFLTADIMASSINSLLDVSENEIATFVIDGIVYHALYKNMNFEDSKMIYVSSGYFGSGLLRTLHLILMIISTIFIAVALFLSNKVAISLSKPILSLSKDVSSFSKGDFIEVSEKADCLEIAELKNSINRMSKQLADHDKAQKTFLLNASHELRTPLMSISGYAEGTINGIFTDEKETSKIIFEESRRLSIIVEKLLTLSRIENDIFDDSLENYDISNLIKDYISKVEGLALSSDVTLNLLVNDADLYCKISETALAQAIINIISNGIRYAKTCVNIEVSNDNGYAKILISDDGQGINDEDLPFIFDRFFKGKDGNLGLGLSISKTAIELMNGTIKAYNNNGAVFEISLKCIK